jgi:hypothetical protein
VKTSNDHETKKEDDMSANLAVEMLFHLMGGMGLFFMGIGVLWWVSILAKEKKA